MYMYIYAYIYTYIYKYIYTYMMCIQSSVAPAITSSSTANTTHDGVQQVCLVFSMFDVKHISIRLLYFMYDMWWLWLVGSIKL